MAPIFTPMHQAIPPTLPRTFTSIIYNVIVLTCARVDLLNQTLNSIAQTLPPERTNLWIWVDRPKHRSERHRATLHYLRRLHVWYPVPRVEIKVLEEHLGTRAMWLNALAIRRPQLVLEDDVMLLSRADEWYEWAFRAMDSDRRILGASFVGQSTVAKVGSHRRLHSKVPFTYPMVGSHGFALSPHAYDAFFRVLQTRKPESLLVPGLITTAWYRELKAQHLEDERMWTQEMVAFAYHHNMTTLYPPTALPFSVHCARDHGIDRSRCHDRYAARPVDQTAMWDPARVRALSWDAKCVRNCFRPWSWFFLQGTFRP